MTEFENTEAVPVETAETPVTPAGETAKPAEAEVGKPVGEKTFTQKELDEIVEKRLARAERKRQRELEATVQGLAAQRPQPESRPADPAEPKREAYADYEQYIDARAEFRARQVVVQERAVAAKEAQEAKAKADRAEAQKAFDVRMREAATKYPDFEDALEFAKGLPITDAMFEAMQLLDEGAELVRLFGTTHADEAHRISQLHPTRQAAEIGKLAAKLAVAPAPQKTALSQAPEPVTPLGGTTTADTSKPPDDPEEFRKWDLARQRAKARGKA